MQIHNPNNVKEIVIRLFIFRKNPCQMSLMKSNLAKIIAIEQYIESVEKVVLEFFQYNQKTYYFEAPLNDCF